VAGVDRGDVVGSSEPVTRPAPGHPGEAQTPIRRAAALGAPEAAATPVPAQAIEPGARPTPVPTTASDAVNELLSNRSGGRERRTVDRSTAEEHSSEFGEKIGSTLGDVFGNKGETWFRSDHAFDNFISPVTNPFLFEDPRSLTEVRPIVLYQKVPSGQANFQGGSAWFFGTQARVAFTDRLSFVLNKLGGTAIDPGSGSPFGSQVGFSELWLGPKYTFIRSEETCSLLAGGLQFQIPIGSQNAFQHTGTLSLVPYASYAQSFGKDWTAGSLNAMLSTGYAFSVNSQRSDYYYLSGHLDWDIMNTHRFYPLVEANWYVYTTNGTTLPVGSEGRDLFNFGGQAKGQGLLTLAFGGRIKISEAAQLGAAFEFPIAGARDLFNYRFTIDFILRY
jgi:hypothetical protein